MIEEASTRRNRVPAWSNERPPMDTETNERTIKSNRMIKSEDKIEFTFCFINHLFK